MPYWGASEKREPIHRGAASLPMHVLASDPRIPEEGKRLWLLTLYLLAPVFARGLREPIGGNLPLAISDSPIFIKKMTKKC